MVASCYARGLATFFSRISCPALALAEAHRPRAAVVGRRAGSSCGGAGRGPWRRARSGRGRCRLAGAGGRRGSSTCHGRCWCATPRMLYRGGRCRRTWPAAARAPVGFVACPPVFITTFVSSLLSTRKSCENLRLCLFGQYGCEGNSRVDKTSYHFQLR